MLHSIQFNSSDLHEKGRGLRFDLPQFGKFASGFVVRYEGSAYAYVNQCAHLPVELDWQAGEFFTSQQDFLICATHGAQYAPDTGYCVFGPCQGKRLQALPLKEHDGLITIFLELH